MGYQTGGGGVGKGARLPGYFKRLAGGSARLLPFNVEASAGPHGRACAWSVHMGRLVAFVFSCLVQWLDVCYHVCCSVACLLLLLLIMYCPCPVSASAPPAERGDLDAGMGERSATLKGAPGGSPCMCTGLTLLSSQLV